MENLKKAMKSKNLQQFHRKKRLFYHENTTAEPKMSLRGILVHSINNVPSLIFSGHRWMSMMTVFFSIY